MDRYIYIDGHYKICMDIGYRRTDRWIDGQTAINTDRQIDTSANFFKPQLPKPGPQMINRYIERRINSIYNIYGYRLQTDRFIGRLTDR